MIELLIVMAIIAVMVGIAVNTMSLDKGREAASSAVEEINQVLNLARLEARGKSTYTWVCFKQVSSNVDNSGIAMAAFASKDGSSNNVSSNLIGLTPYRLLRNVTLDSAAQASSRLNKDFANLNMSDVGSLPATTVAMGIQPNKSFPVNSSMVAFNPRGVPLDVSKQFVGVFVYPTRQDPNQKEKGSSVLVSRTTGVSKLFY